MRVERRTDPDTGGQKDVKLARYDLIPARALHRLAILYGRGAQKYAENNWRRGYRWGYSFGSMMRHAWAFWRGRLYDPDWCAHGEDQDHDPDECVPHLSAVAWHAFTLLTFALDRLGKDDRPGAPAESEEESGGGCRPGFLSHDWFHAGFGSYQCARCGASQSKLDTA